MLCEVVKIKDVILNPLSRPTARHLPSGLREGQNFAKSKGNQVNCLHPHHSAWETDALPIELTDSSLDLNSNSTHP